MCHYHEGGREAYLEALREELDIEEDPGDSAAANDEAEDPSVEAEPTPADD